MKQLSDLFEVLHDDGGSAPAAEPTSVVCPKCGSLWWTYYGKTPDGRQKFKCKEPHCRHPFTAEPRGRRIDEKTKRVVLRMLGEGIPPRKIIKFVPDIKLRWIYELKRRVKNDR
jgi:transposase-like protein